MYEPNQKPKRASAKPARLSDSFGIAMMQSIGTNLIPPVRSKDWLLPIAVGVVALPLWTGMYEPSVFYFLNRHLSVITDSVWALLCLTGTAWCLFALTSPWLLLRPQLVVAWLCAAPFAGLFARIGKMLPDNPRPLEVLPAATIHVIGEPVYVAAMPSGHTLAAFAVATAIYFSMPLPRRKSFCWLFGLAIAVALARVAVGAHWPADVSAGAALGMLSGLLGVTIAGKIPQRHFAPNAWLMRGTGVFGCLSLYVLLSDDMGFPMNAPYQLALSVFLLGYLVLFAKRSFSTARATF